MGGKYTWLFLFTIVLIGGCKKKSGDDSGIQDEKKVTEVAATLKEVEKKFLGYGVQTNGTAQQALAMTYEWLRVQPEIKEAILYDSLILNFELQSGLTGTYFIVLTDAQGHPLSRGGGSGGAKLKSTAGSAEITNRKVLILSVQDDFYKPGEMDRIVSLFNSSSKQLKVKLVEGYDCKPAYLDSLIDYGFVIIDSHGFPDGILIGGGFESNPQYDTSEAELKNYINYSNGAQAYDRIMNGQLRLMRGVNMVAQPANWQSMVGKGEFGFIATSKFINSLNPMPQTVVFSNACYSGWSLVDNWTKLPIKTAFESRTPITYYHYAFNSGSSAKVSNDFAKEMEDSLVRSLVIDFDSTGQAHLQHTGGEFIDPAQAHVLFKQSGSANYSYDVCIDSFTDARDGTVYKAACIGGQVWMAENLKYNAPGSTCYDLSPSNCDKYGRMYTWTQVMAGAASSATIPSGVKGVCPQGWHVPSNAEWQKLLDFVGGASVAGGPLKAVSPLWLSPNTGATNSTGFAALPGGLGDSTYTSFSDVGVKAYFWSATRMDDTFCFPFSMSYAGVYVYGNPGRAEKQLSCRCVKD